MKKIILAIFCLSVFESCAITGILECNEKNLNLHKCNRITCAVEKCVKKNNSYEFEKVEFVCQETVACECGEAVNKCYQLNCVECSPDGQFFSCETFNECQSKFETVDELY